MFKMNISDNDLLKMYSLEEKHDALAGFAEEIGAVNQKISLDIADFKKLISGEVIQKNDIEIVISNIGQETMKQIVNEADSNIEC